MIRFGRAGIDSITSGNVTVPNLVGMTEEEAKSSFADWNFVTVDSDATDEVAVGCIMGQSPTFGTYVAPGRAIDVIVNRGLEVEEGTMPFLRGMELDKAMQQLEGYTVNTVYEYDENVLGGSVKGTQPDFGETLTEGQEVFTQMQEEDYSFSMW